MPRVDVFIRYCGEDPEVLLDTVRAACAVDYPRDKARIVVLDDNQSVEVSNAVTEIPNLHYTSRRIQVKTPSKAANLTRGGWPPAVLLWAGSVKQAWLPLSYALFTKTDIKREELLNRDSKTFVAYPSARAKEKQHRQVRHWHFWFVSGFYAMALGGLFWL